MTKEYKVVGPRVLVKVKKLNEKFENSSILMPADSMETSTIAQTRGEILQIGPSAKSQYEGFDDLEIGQIVCFQRYGAQRLGTKDHNDYETWLINAKDIIAIEITKEEV